MINIMYCGNDKMERGLVLSITSVLRHTRELVKIFVLTMSLQNDEKVFYPISKGVVNYLDRLAKNINLANEVKLLDLTNIFKNNMPIANMNTRFTPYCMLRLYADLIPEIPTKVLYLDTDVIARRDIGKLYNTDVDNYDVAGVLDYYGSWLFRRNLLRRDYLNSGVLILNMERIRNDRLFENCRLMCAKKQMFMPDQSAINRVASRKKVLPRRYNEQRVLKRNTILQHFTTSFRFIPVFHTVSVKPWEIEKIHHVLNLYEYDELIGEYEWHWNEINKCV